MSRYRKMCAVFPWLNCYKRSTLCIIMTLEKCSYVYHVWPYKHSYMCHMWPHRNTVVCRMCDQTHSYASHVWLHRHVVTCWCVPTFSKFIHTLQALVTIGNNKKNKSRVSPNNIYFNFVLLFLFYIFVVHST